MIPLLGRRAFIPLAVVKEQVSLDSGLLVGRDQHIGSMALQALHPPCPFGLSLHGVRARRVDVEAHDKIRSVGGDIAAYILGLAEAADPVFLVEKRNVQGYPPRFLMT